MERHMLFYRRHKTGVIRGWCIIGCILLAFAAYASRPWRLLTYPKKLPDLLKIRNTVNASKDLSSWGYVNIFDEDVSHLNATCLDYKLMEPFKGSTKLCVHSLQEDELVSGSFIKGGYWESQHLTPIGNILRAHPEMVFMDIGSHVGMYAMYANGAGHQAIAVDPLKKNLRLLRKSVQLAHQEENVVILLNAVSNKHEKLYLEQAQFKNIGSTFLVPADKKVNEGRQAADYRIQTITLDDLLEVFDLDNREVMMKMDVEGYEWLALKGGYEFFRRVNVCYVMMEFIAHLKRPSGQQIVDFMKSFNMFPYRDFTLRISLSEHYLPEHYPMETVFAKHTEQCKKRYSSGKD